MRYQDVFGVEPGDDLPAGRGPNYTPCQAVTSLRRLLGSHSFFSGKIGGTGPLVRPGNVHEFNRHHAGLAVDIMLDQRSASEVALGHNLVMLFHRNRAIMHWLGIIYQDVVVDTAGNAHRYTDGGHEDHIHVDWFSGGVTYREGISSVRLMRRSGDPQILTVRGNHLAEVINWPAESGTNFETDATLIRELGDLMREQAAGNLRLLDLPARLGLAEFDTASELDGRWLVTIGSWEGVFVFNSNGRVHWSPAVGSRETHPGRWTATATEVRWSFNDPGDFRTFTAAIPLDRGGVAGSILPAGQGFFKMRKLG